MDAHHLAFLPGISPNLCKGQSAHTLQICMPPARIWADLPKKPFAARAARRIPKSSCPEKRNISRLSFARERNSRRSFRARRRLGSKRDHNEKRPGRSRAFHFRIGVCYSVGVGGCRLSLMKRSNSSWSFAFFRRSRNSPKARCSSASLRRSSSSLSTSRAL